MNLPNFIFNEAGTTLKNYLGKEDSVVVPNNVTTLGNRAFYGTSVGEVILPEGVKSIGKQCFWNCYALVKIELPKTLKTIKEEAFRSCLALFEIRLPKSLTKIGAGAFYNCNIKKAYYDGTRADWEKIQMEDGEVDTLKGEVFFSNREFLSSVVVFEGEDIIEENQEEIKFKDSLKNYIFPAGYEEYFYKETGVEKGSLELCCACFDEMTDVQKADYVKTKKDPYGMIDFVKSALLGDHFACAWIAIKLMDGYSDTDDGEFFDSWGKRFVQARDVDSCLYYLSYAMQKTGKTNLAIRCYRVASQYGNAEQKQKCQMIDFVYKFSNSNNIVDVEELYESLDEESIEKGLNEAKNHKEWENFIFLYCVKKSSSFNITDNERKTCKSICNELGIPNIFHIIEGEDSKVESDVLDELAIIDEAKGIKEFSAWKECWTVLLFEYIEKYTDKDYNQHATIFVKQIQLRESYANQYKDLSVWIALKYYSALKHGDKNGQENAEKNYNQVVAISALQGKVDTLVPLEEKPSQVDVYESIYRGAWKFSGLGNLDSFWGSNDEEIETEGEDETTENRIEDDCIDWDNITTYDGDCSVFVKFPDGTGYHYNCNEMISVGAKVKVSGKLAGRIGVVDRIGPWDKSSYMQKVVEIVSEERPEPVAIMDNDESTQIVREIEHKVSISSYRVEKKKKQKKITILVASALAFIVAFVVILTTVIMPNSRRNEYLANGEYGKIVEMDNLTKFIVPDGVKAIKDGAFKNCDSLESVVIPDSVTSIGEYAFENCTSLKLVTFGKNSQLERIDLSAFKSCRSLEEITFGKNDKLKSIAIHAFEGCTSLKRIVIPNSVTSIGLYAFYKCYRLTIYCEAESKPNGWDGWWNKKDNYSNCPAYWYSETEPTKEGNYWHYVNGVVTVW